MIPSHNPRPRHPVLSAAPSPRRPRSPPSSGLPRTEASLPLSCWKQEALLSGSRGCRRTPLLGLGLSYSLSGSMACSLSMAGSECGGRDCGNPNIKREEKKSKAPQSRKPPHQAPIQRGSSGVMSRLPAIREGGVSRRGRQRGRDPAALIQSGVRMGRGRCKGPGAARTGCRARRPVLHVGASVSAKAEDGSLSHGSAIRTPCASADRSSAQHGCCRP